MSSSGLLINVIKKSAELMEYEGFTVMGFTLDQLSNLEKTFRLLGAKPERPVIHFNNQSYFVHKDPSHLLKCARNLLMKKDVYVPGEQGKASWSHIEKLHEIDTKNSLRLCPKLTDKHIHGLKFGSSMKVILAAQVLSHSVSSGFLYVKSYNLMDGDILTTVAFCKKIMISLML